MVSEIFEILKKCPLGMKCLNPCFTGRWYRRVLEITRGTYHGVLILVVLEDGIGVKCLCGNYLSCLNPCFTGRWYRSSLKKELKKYAPTSLNPCFTGRWYRSSDTNTIGSVNVAQS